MRANVFAARHMIHTTENAARRAGVRRGVVVVLHPAERHGKSSILQNAGPVGIAWRVLPVHYVPITFGR
jgi:hypothetical protein